MTGDDFRRLVLDMPGAIESAHMGHPDFRANGRIFATLQADEQQGMVKLLPDEQGALMAERPAVFVPASGAWGRQGCTMVRLAGADEATVRGAVVLAWQHVAERQRSRRPSTRPAVADRSIQRRKRRP